MQVRLLLLHLLAATASAVAGVWVAGCLACQRLPCCTYIQSPPGLLPHRCPPLPPTLLQLNLGLLAFNLLLPAFPLDGGRIFADLLLMAGVAPRTAAQVTAVLATLLGLGVVALGVWRTWVASVASVLTIFVGEQAVSSLRSEAALLLCVLLGRLLWALAGAATGTRCSCWRRRRAPCTARCTWVYTQPACPLSPPIPALRFRVRAPAVS